MELLLKNVTPYDTNEVCDVRIFNDVIVERAVNLHRKKKEEVVEFNGEVLYPGLTNWHDHLEMNLYPRLGTPPYNNYTEWSKDIYKPKESPLREIESTDLEYRLLWGGLKNLISGVTTVVHHNPWKSILGKNSFPVFVPKIAWSHSLEFEKKLPTRIDPKVPFIIHAGEGVDDLARKEIPRLNELGLLQKNTFLVHAVSADWNLIDSRGSSVIWCPSSNFYMFNRTAEVKGRKNVFLGTDSTLTGSPTLLDEMKVASKFISKEEIFKMVMADSKGFFVARKIKENAIDNLFELQTSDISLVYRNGIRLMNGKPIGIDVEKLRRHFEKKVGLNILEKNPLWGMIN